MLFVCRGWECFEYGEKPQVDIQEENTKKNILVQRMQSLSSNKPEGNKEEYEEIPYVAKPVTKGDLLLNYQYDYLVNHSTEAWNKLWELSFEFCKNYVKKYYASNHRKASEEEIIDGAIAGCEQVLRRYKKTNRYYIKYAGGFFEQLRGGVLNVISPAHKRKIEKKTRYYDAEELRRISDERQKNYE